MNKESKQIIEFIQASGFYLDKIDKLKKRFPNIKDFQNQFGYIVMEIVSENKQFFKLNRNNIELPELTQKYFS